MSVPRTQLSRLAALPRLWWRAKGFGIHSPSAYRYVRSVVDEKCHYYVYERVDALAKSAGMSRRTARMLMRVALWEQSPTAVCMGVRPQVKEMVTAWDSRAVAAGEYAAGCRMMVAGAGKADERAILSAVERIMEGGGTIVLLDADEPSGAARTVLDRWLDEEDRTGVLMTDGRSAIMHVEPGVPGQYYEMLL